MEIERAIEGFHKKLRYQKDSKVNTLRLKTHQYPTIKTFNPNRVAVKVRNFHFEILEVLLYIPDGAVVTKQPIIWQKTNDHNRLYGLKAGIEHALRVLYYLDIPLGECIVQRMDSKCFSVYDVRDRSSNLLTTNEKIKILTLINRYEKPRSLTFGADIETMVYHQLQNKWIAASALLKEDDNIGWDAAAVLQNKKVIHPILELRPEPGTTAQQLFTNLLQLCIPFFRCLERDGLKVVGGSNPYKHFFLGSHLHIGDEPLTFKHASLLDAYIGIPIALIDYNRPVERRKNFGKLGAVRKNAFNGYEYRTLSSVGENILETKPLFEMFAYINENITKLPLFTPSLQVINAFYEHNRQELFYYLITCKQFLKKNVSEKDYEALIHPFFEWIENRYKMKSMNQKKDL